MMARRTAKEPRPGEWQYTVGEPPVQLTAYERKDKGNRIYTRVWDGARIHGKRALAASIRDDRGRIDPEREIEAQRATLQRHEALAAGLSEDDAPPGVLTLAAGFRLLLHPKKGKYVGRTQYVREVKGHAQRITKVLRPDLCWNQVRHPHYRQLWRSLAEGYRDSDAYGLRQAEVMLAILQSAARWLQAEGYIEPGAALPAPGWKQTMAREWEAIVGSPVPEARAPRYKDAERERLWAALPDARVDPRLWLAMDIGAELRLGQVPRSRRSDVTMDEAGRPFSVRVHGRGKKHGELVVLTPEQAATLDHHMSTGYLRLLEAEHRAGRVDDYYLIPGGRLLHWKNGARMESPVAQVKNALRELGSTALAKWWKTLEEVAGVKHMPHRRWYGMRRLQSDRAEDVETDDRVLNRMGGWTDSKTRRGYQEKGRTKIQEKAAGVRRKIRPHKDLPTNEEEGPG